MGGGGQGEEVGAEEQTKKKTFLSHDAIPKLTTGEQTSGSRLH